MLDGAGCGGRHAAAADGWVGPAVGGPRPFGRGVLTAGLPCLLLPLLPPRPLQAMNNNYFLWIIGIISFLAIASKLTGAI